MVNTSEIDGGGVTGVFSCDRRGLLASVCCGLLLASALVAAARTTAPTAKGARLSFFDDRPLIDRSGKLPAYQPPKGFRGGAPLSEMDEEGLRRLSPFMT